MEENVPDGSICCFCQTTEKDEALYGKFYKYQDIITHYFCLLLASKILQRGSDEDGILGFLPNDIVNEVKRGKNLSCVFCGKRGATIGCYAPKCKVHFHLPCGRKQDTFHQFFGEFKSFCPKHRIRQKINRQVVKAMSGRKAVNCVICLEPVSAKPAPNTLWAPCCSKEAWFHRLCVQRLALSAGYFFKCPLCNNTKQFVEAMRTYGIWVPEQDASWEAEPERYSSLLERHNSCDAKSCRCRQGRTFHLDNTRWEIKLCVDCGSQGMHVQCGNLRVNDDWVCPICSSVTVQKENLAQTNKGNQDRRIGQNSSRRTSRRDQHVIRRISTRQSEAPVEPEDGEDEDVDVVGNKNEEEGKIPRNEEQLGGLLENTPDDHTPQTPLPSVSISKKKGKSRSGLRSSKRRGRPRKSSQSPTDTVTHHKEAPSNATSIAKEKRNFEIIDIDDNSDGGDDDDVQCDRTWGENVLCSRKRQPPVCSCNGRNSFRHYASSCNSNRRYKQQYLHHGKSFAKPYGNELIAKFFSELALCQHSKIPLKEVFYTNLIFPNAHIVQACPVSCFSKERSSFKSFFAPGRKERKKTSIPDGPCVEECSKRVNENSKVPVCPCPGTSSNESGIQDVEDSSVYKFRFQGVRKGRRRKCVSTGREKTEEILNSHVPSLTCKRKRRESCTSLTLVKNSIGTEMKKKKTMEEKNEEASSRAKSNSHVLPSTFLSGEISETQGVKNISDLANLPSFQPFIVLDKISDERLRRRTVVRRERSVSVERCSSVHTSTRERKSRRDLFLEGKTMTEKNTSCSDRSICIQNSRKRISSKLSCIQRCSPVNSRSQSKSQVSGTSGRWRQRVHRKRQNSSSPSSVTTREYMRHKKQRGDSGQICSERRSPIRTRSRSRFGCPIQTKSRSRFKSGEVIEKCPNISERWMQKDHTKHGKISGGPSLVSIHESVPPKKRRSSSRQIHSERSSPVRTRSRSRLKSGEVIEKCENKISETLERGVQQVHREQSEISSNPNSVSSDETLSHKNKRSCSRLRHSTRSSPVRTRSRSRSNYGEIKEVCTEKLTRKETSYWNNESSGVSSPTRRKGIRSKNTIDTSESPVPTKNQNHGRQEFSEKESMSCEVEGVTDDVRVDAVQDQCPSSLENPIFKQSDDTRDENSGMLDYNSWEKDFINFGAFPLLYSSDNMSSSDETDNEINVPEEKLATALGSILQKGYTSNEEYTSTSDETDDELYVTEEEVFRNNIPAYISTLCKVSHPSHNFLPTPEETSGTDESSDSTSGNIPSSSGNIPSTSAALRFSPLPSCDRVSTTFGHELNKQSSCPPSSELKYSLTTVDENSSSPHLQSGSDTVSCSFPQQISKKSTDYGNTPTKVSTQIESGNDSFVSPLMCPSSPLSADGLCDLSKISQLQSISESVSCSVLQQQPQQSLDFVKMSTVCNPPEHLHNKIHSTNDPSVLSDGSSGVTSCESPSILTEICAYSSEASKDTCSLEHHRSLCESSRIIKSSSGTLTRESSATRARLRSRSGSPGASQPSLCSRLRSRSGSPGASRPSIRSKLRSRSGSPGASRPSIRSKLRSRSGSPGNAFSRKSFSECQAVEWTPDIPSKTRPQKQVHSVVQNECRMKAIALTARKFVPQSRVQCEQRQMMLLLQELNQRKGI